MNRAARTAIVLTLLGLIAVVALFVSTSESKFGDEKRAFADLGGDFSLTASHGEVALQDYRNKVVVMYFGFMTCPEVCPNSMAVIQTALQRLSDDELNQTQAMLVSIDPKRDTPEKLSEYVQYFHPNLIGVTGSQKEIDQVTRQYGAYYNFTEIESVTADYGVEHSSRYYVIDQHGKLVAAMRHSTTPNELHAQITELLN